MIDRTVDENDFSYFKQSKMLLDSLNRMTADETDKYLDGSSTLGYILLSYSRLKDQVIILK